jgi:hypothetical protein
MTKIAGSGSESISQRHGSADPDPPQNVMDPQHCFNESLLPDSRERGKMGRGGEKRKTKKKGREVSKEWK